jgi:DNA helicase HerA-like ATPase
VLNIAFRIADEEGLLLLDLKDLQALLANIAENARRISARYGNVTKPSVGAIQRALLVLEQQGGGELLRRAGAEDRRPDAHDAATAAARSTCWPPTS